jgi:hypothetical protein
MADISEQHVDGAAREANGRQRRARAYAQFIELGRSGMFDVLLDKRNYRGGCSGVLIGTSAPARIS